MGPRSRKNVGLQSAGLVGPLYVYDWVGPANWVGLSSSPRSRALGGPPSTPVSPRCIGKVAPRRGGVSRLPQWVIWRTPPGGAGLARILHALAHPPGLACFLLARPVGTGLAYPPCARHLLVACCGSGGAYDSGWVRHMAHGLARSLHARVPYCDSCRTSAYPTILVWY